MYDDSLSYYETLAKVVDYLNTCINNVNYLNEIYGPLSNKVVELETRLETLKATVSASILELNQRCTSIEDRQDRDFIALKQYTDNIAEGLTTQLNRLEEHYNVLVGLYEIFIS